MSPVRIMLITKLGDKSWQQIREKPHALTVYSHILIVLLYSSTNGPQSKGGEEKRDLRHSHCVQKCIFALPISKDLTSQGSELFILNNVSGSI